MEEWMIVYRNCPTLQIDESDCNANKFYWKDSFFYNHSGNGDMENRSDEDIGVFFWDFCNAKWEKGKIREDGNHPEGWYFFVPEKKVLITCDATVPVG